MNLNEASHTIFLYDLFDSVEVEAFHCWFRFYSPSRDDEDWLIVNVRLRLDNSSIRLQLYDESLIAEIFRKVFGKYSTEIDNVERSGDTGIYYYASFTDGQPYPAEEGRSPVKESELNRIRYIVVRKLRIEGIKILEGCDKSATLS